MQTQWWFWNSKTDMEIWVWCRCQKIPYVHRRDMYYMHVRIETHQDATDGRRLRNYRIRDAHRVHECALKLRVSTNQSHRVLSPFLPCLLSLRRTVCTRDHFKRELYRTQYMCSMVYRMEEKWNRYREYRLRAYSERNDNNRYANGWERWRSEAIEAHCTSFFKASCAYYGCLYTHIPIYVHTRMLDRARVWHAGRKREMVRDRGRADGAERSLNFSRSERHVYSHHPICDWMISIA